MAELTYRDAVIRGIAQEMTRDEDVVFLGEDVAKAGGVFKATVGLYEQFGPLRVRDTPISENTIVGMGVGAAMLGLRPVVELMTINFSLLALDQIVNHAAHIHYMFGGQVKVPLVVRMPQGAGHQLGPTHSHSWESIYVHVPGILVAVPSTPADAKGLLKAAIRDAFFGAATKAPEAYAKLSDGKNKPWAPVTNADYDDTIKLIKFVDGLKKKS